MKDYSEEHLILKDAMWFAEHKQVATALSLVDDTFDSFLDFRVWFLVEDENSEFSEKFRFWVAKVMVLFYDGHCSQETQQLVNLTYSEICKRDRRKWKKKFWSFAKNILVKSISLLKPRKMASGRLVM